MEKIIETKRRTIIKTLLWRIIGIVWTWLGAYIIFILTPEKYRSASIIATLIVVYHHSTRLIMYYFYERIWINIKWGKISDDGQKNLSFNQKIIWYFIIIVSIIFVLYLLVYIAPMIEGKSK